MRRSLLAALLLVGGKPGWALSPPTSASYPARPIYTGPSAAPDLSQPYARIYRTSIREAAKTPTNFAGHYSLVFVGCGSDECIRGVILDRYTGRTRPVPFGFCGAKELYDVIDVVSFKPDSRLVVFTGLYDCGHAKGTYYYDFDGRTFRLVVTRPLPKPRDDAAHPD